MSGSDGLMLRLERLDALLHREMLRKRARDDLSNNELQGLHVSDSQVDSLLDDLAEEEGSGEEIRRLESEARRYRDLIDEFEGTDVFGELVLRLQWTELERDVVLLAIAADVDVKYERVFAYLNDSLVMRWPTIEVASRLFSNDDEPPREFVTLLRDSRLSYCGAVRLVPEHARASDRWSRIVLSDALRSRLSGSAALPAHWDAVHRVLPPSPDSVQSMQHMRRDAEAASRFFAREEDDGRARVLVVTGGVRAGSDRFVSAIGAAAGRGILSVDAVGWLESTGRLADDEDLVLTTKIEDAVLHIAGIDEISDHEPGVKREALRRLRRMLERSDNAIVSCEDPSIDALAGLRRLEIRLREPGLANAGDLWRSLGAARNLRLETGVAKALAARFRLGPTEIERSLERAHDRRLAQGATRREFELHELAAAAREESSRRMGRVAEFVEGGRGLDALVLPSSVADRVREIADAIENREQVHTAWRMTESSVASRALCVLLAGPPGIGKSMTARCLAVETGLALYRVDLATVVSKYIGETEKNLDRIFDAAEGANAILFFDEADALFGARTEVKDAHDRYANLETSYLLQKLESHDGVVLLATNFAGNIDEAFSRRLRRIDFPRPNEECRRELWAAQFPEEAPVSEDVDFDMLAREFELTGAEIRNAAVDAAYLAAGSGTVIGMQQIVQVLERRFRKTGRLPSRAVLRRCRLAGSDARSATANGMGTPKDSNPNGGSDHGSRCGT